MAASVKTWSVECRFTYACLNNDLVEAQLLFRCEPQSCLPLVNSIFGKVCRNGHVRLAQWLYSLTMTLPNSPTFLLDIRDKDDAVLRSVLYSAQFFCFVHCVVHNASTRFQHLKDMAFWLERVYIHTLTEKVVHSDPALKFAVQAWQHLRWLGGLRAAWIRVCVVKKYK